MDRQELELTAELANIELSESELDAFNLAVSELLAHFQTMAEIDVDELEPTTHPVLQQNRLRPDQVEPSDLSDALLENAPELEDRFIVIPNVL
jgi:aspartyl-tRNA(Asn)/glutamyl-tRNA(Gln) amidotransferase subunit C